MEIKMGNMLFYGELFPASVHGVAIANQINIEMLKASFHIDIIQEYSNLSDHGKIHIRKFLNVIKNDFAIISNSILHKYRYFYLAFSLSTFGSVKTLSAIMCFRLFNRGKVVLHLHRGDFFSTFYKNRINRIISKLIIKFSSRLIVLSDNQKSEFEGFFNIPCHVLPNTVEIEYPPILQNRSTLSFLYISNYLIDKGILELLEVFTKLSEQYRSITLKTYGSFADENLKDTILKFNTSNISINGPISGSNKFKVISESDCLILPSWNEGQPIILLEAMSVGTPIIASNVGLIRELIGEDYPFFMKARDKDSLEHVMIKFMNLENTDFISQNLLDSYRSKYSQKKHAERLNNIFVQ
jgi:glycosyltransferase involved in cell wall biosynthesis